MDNFIPVEPQIARIEEVPQSKYDYKIIAIGGLIVLVIILIVYILFFNKDSREPPQTVPPDHIPTNRSAAEYSDNQKILPQSQVSQSDIEDLKKTFEVPAEETAKTTDTVIDIEPEKIVEN